MKSCKLQGEGSCCSFLQDFLYLNTSLTTLSCLYIAFQLIVLQISPHKLSFLYCKKVNQRAEHEQTNRVVRLDQRPKVTLMI